MSNSPLNNTAHFEEDDEELPAALPPPTAEELTHIQDALYDPSQSNGEPNLANPDVNVMTMAELVNERYVNFNKALIELSALVDSFPNDKKTIRSIQSEYVKLYERFFDVIKYIYGLDITDPSVKPGKSADRILFKREVLDPKRIVDPSGEKLFIYKDKDGKYRFTDETYANGEGITLNDIAFWVANRDNFADGDVSVQNSPVCVTIFGKTAYIPTKGLRLPGTDEDPAEDRFWAILNRIYKTIGALLSYHRDSKK